MFKHAVSGAILALWVAIAPPVMAQPVNCTDFYTQVMALYQSAPFSPQYAEMAATYRATCLPGASATPAYPPYYYPQYTAPDYQPYDGYAGPDYSDYGGYGYGVPLAVGLGFGAGFHHHGEFHDHDRFHGAGFRSSGGFHGGGGHGGGGHGDGGHDHH